MEGTIEKAASNFLLHLNNRNITDYVADQQIKKDIHVGCSFVRAPLNIFTIRFVRKKKKRFNYLGGIHFRLEISVWYSSVFRKVSIQT